MASGFSTLQGSIYRNLSRCGKHSIRSLNPSKTRWRPITSVSFHAGFLDDTYMELNKEDNEIKTLNYYTLKKKEKGDWRNLTLQEKRALYHLSFNQPLCDVEQSAEEWKLILGGAFTAMGLLTLGLYMWISQGERVENSIAHLPLQLDPKEKEAMSMQYHKNFSSTS